MRKNILLILSVAAIYLFSGCASNNSGMDDDSLMKALEASNQYDAILEKNGSFVMKVYGTHADGTIDDYTLYFSDGRYVNDNKYRTLITENGDVYGFDKTYNLPMRYLFIGDYYNTHETEFCPKSGFEYSEKEKVTSRREENGRIYLETSISTDDPAAAATLASWGFSPDEIDSEHTEYTIDAGSLLILELKSYVVTGDKRILYSNSVLDLDAEEYVPDQSIIDGVFGDDFRTLTVIADADTDEEKAYSQTVTRGSLIYSLMPDEYEQMLYVDSACTIEKDSMDLVSDQTYYLKRLTP